MDFKVQCGPLPLPETVMHEGHEHPLALSSKFFVKYDSHQLFCNVCHKERNAEHVAYFCAICEFYAHVLCAITGIQVDEREKLRHFSHQHFLFPLENKGNDGIVCRACEKDIQTDPAYGCDNCEFYLHKYCAELPSERQHPFHRHSLRLLSPSVGNIRCYACLKYCDGFTYSCEDCDFHMDLDCSLLFPSIKFESHEHLLTYFKKLHGSPICNNCRSDHPDKFSLLGVPYFRCVNCDFNVHSLCSPLPQIINHDSHWHSLTLGDNLVDLVGRRYDDEYYCDVCENKRDAREYVYYYCEECNFVVDLDCVIVEVLHSLQGKRGDVQLRIVRRKGSAFKGIIESLTEKEQKILKRLELETKEELEQIKEDGSEAKLRFLKMFGDFDKDMVESVISNVPPLYRELHDDECDERIDNVGDYTISLKFAPLLRNLLAKYGNIGASSILTQRLQTFFLHIFCATVNSMNKTKVKGITYYLISRWWADLELVHRAGFSIDFAFDHLKRVAHARFVLCGVISESSGIRKTPLYSLHKKIAKRFQEIDERVAEVENLRKRVHNEISGRASERSRSEAKRLSEAMELWFKKIELL